MLSTNGTERALEGGFGGSALSANTGLPRDSTDRQKMATSFQTYLYDVTG